VRVRCHLCGEALDSTYAMRKVTGWARTPQNTAPLRLREPHDEYAHPHCVDREARGIAASQPTLGGE
jgi:hypothetical protein